MSSKNKQELAGEVWRLMSDFSTSQFRQKSSSLRDLGLTPGHIKALITLSPGEARPMGACAQDMGCDASTATWLIDRLEERGLVERKPSATDRRVKEVVMTERGEVTRFTLQEHFYEPPAELLGLDAESLEDLLRVLSLLKAPEPVAARQ